MQTTGFKVNDTNIDDSNDNATSTEWVTDGDYHNTIDSRYIGRSRSEWSNVGARLNHETHVQTNGQNWFRSFRFGGNSLQPDWPRWGHSTGHHQRWNKKVSFSLVSELSELNYQRRFKTPTVCEKPECRKNTCGQNLYQFVQSIAPARTVVVRIIMRSCVWKNKNEKHFGGTI